MSDAPDGTGVGRRGWPRREVLRLLGTAAVAAGLGACSTSSDGSDGASRSGTGSNRNTTTRSSRPADTTTTSAASPPTEADWADLRAALGGGVVLPDDGAYDTDRRLFNPVFDGVRPQGIAHCRSAADVAASLAFARRHDVPFAVRGGGHSFGGYSTSDGLVLDLTPASAVQVRAGGTATVGAGARLIDVYAGLAERGVMIPAGSCPTVGIAGLTLGGGVGVVSRRYGLTIDHLQAAEVVLADGRTITCDAEHDPDLFWALRGGGAGSFGVVTSFTFRTDPAPDLALATLRWPWSRAAAVLAAWQEWAPTAEDALWSNALLLAGNPGEGDEPTVRVGAVYVGGASALAGLLDDLVRRVGSAPIRRTSRTAGYLDAMKFEGGCAELSIDECRLPSQGAAGRVAREGSVARAEYLRDPLPSPGVQAIVDAVGQRQADPDLAGGGAAFDAYGGAINRVAPTATAFVHRRPSCGVLLNGTFPDDASPATVDANRRWCDDLGGALSSYVDGEAYQNYVDPRRTDWAEAYYGENLPRLREVKGRYDPDDVFHFAQSIPLP